MFGLRSVLLQCVFVGSGGSALPMLVLIPLCDLYYCVCRLLFWGVHLCGGKLPMKYDVCRAAVGYITLLGGGFVLVPLC